MMVRFLAAFAVPTCLAGAALAGGYIGADESRMRGLYYPGPANPSTEIYVFPLAATTQEMAFAICPFEDLPDHSGDQGTACHIEWLDADGDRFLPARREEVKGCTIADHWNEDCPDFTAEGMTLGNSEKLVGSLEKTHPEVSGLFKGESGAVEKITPFILAAPQGAATSDAYAADRLKYDFGMFDDCKAYSANPGYAAACRTAMASTTAGAEPIGVSAMEIGKHGAVCVIAKDWSIAACAQTPPSN
ncbi:hypothetical protein [Paracoccus aminophilus]|uniref:Secreted protein n=1 Tax=Paracoccus aminophilus JCM 7686 TaxID=1367847 RepID=S5XYL0_PARAH|nr:hypothetical protein [Paracoccus aminophilus]AGT08520.1 hypothetical protein JCM7686_1419 [Paracoccus aminophilus JCM 7686]